MKTCRSCTTNVRYNTRTYVVRYVQFFLPLLSYARTVRVLHSAYRTLSVVRRGCYRTVPVLQSATNSTSQANTPQANDICPIDAMANNPQPVAESVCSSGVCWLAASRHHSYYGRHPPTPKWPVHLLELPASHASILACSSTPAAAHPENLGSQHTRNHICAASHSSLDKQLALY